MSSQFTNDPLNDWDNNDNDAGGSGVLVYYFY